MRYTSTRQTTGSPRPFSDILLEGLAPDGGLYVPERYPRLSADDLEALRRVLDQQGYAALAARILALYIDDIPEEDIAAMASRAYSAPAFSDPAIVPVTALEGAGFDLRLAHLSLGPTAAFKDMAMQLLGELFEYELRRHGQWLTIVGATSGDTGSSAEYALRGRDGLSVVMLTPAGRMTAFQRAQMFSLLDDNIVNVAVDGVFDDCQDLVKAVNMDAAFKARWHLGAVNSINWARLLAQVVYYVATWLRATEGPGGGSSSARPRTGKPCRCRRGASARRGTVAPERVSVVVPTGNFGNVCAAHIARRMGVPLDALVVATNENDVLDEFFRTGVYRPRSSDQTLATSSPSMDISKASNFERFVHDLLGRDGARPGPQRVLRPVGHPGVRGGARNLRVRVHLLHARGPPRRDRAHRGRVRVPHRPAHRRRRPRGARARLAGRTGGHSRRHGDRAARQVRRHDHGGHRPPAPRSRAFRRDRGGRAAGGAHGELR